MSSQVLRTQELTGWVEFLRAHKALVRELNSQLVTEHGVTLSDYEVLLQLAYAPGRRLRRVDLVEKLQLTPSGITRLLRGLEEAGWVATAECESDRRVTYAVLTDAGLGKLRESADTHLAGVEELFLSRFSDEERQTLAGLLGRLPAADVPPCGPDD